MRQCSCIIFFHTNTTISTRNVL
jgi:hypothetical protein